MTNTLNTSYSFFACINPDQESQLSYWSKKFSIDSLQLRKIIHIAGPVVKDVHDYLQTLKPKPVSLKSHQQLLQEYTAFVTTLCNNYKHDYQSYLADGGTESFLKCCWRLMMKEAVDEAATILEAYENKVPDALKLLSDMQDTANRTLIKTNADWQAAL